MKWAVELVQFDIDYVPRPAIKAKALADFIVEFTGPVEEEAEAFERPMWELYVDGSSNKLRVRAGILLVNLDGHKIFNSLKFGFRATNNEAEYKVVLGGLRLAREMRAEQITIFSNSQLVVCQVRGEYQTRGSKMIAYLKKVQELLKNFSKV